MGLVIYYSLSGHSRKFAEEFAAANNAELVEVKTEKNLSKLGAYTKGLLKSFKNAPMPIQPLSLSDCGTADIFAPVWAGGIAPPIIGALKQLRAGTKVNLHLVSASGRSEKSRVEPLIKDLGLEILSFEDIKA